MNAGTLPDAWRKARSVVVAGNGPSLATADALRIDARDPVVRTNNFFLERAYHVGERVDLIHIAGDPRIIPFYVATLREVVAAGDYAVGAWSSHHSALSHRIGTQLPFPYTAFAVRDAHVRANLKRLVEKYQRVPTGGIYALINAHSYGAETITVCGIDLYGLDRRYAFPTGRHMRDLLGDDLDFAGYQEPIHSRDVDMEAFDYLAGRGDCRIFCASPDSPLLNHCELAPPAAQPLRVRKKAAKTVDWSDRAGLYPIDLLKVLRRLRALPRKVARRMMK